MFATKTPRGHDINFCKFSQPSPRAVRSDIPCDESIVGWGFHPNKILKLDILCANKASRFGKTLIIFEIQSKQFFKVPGLFYTCREVRRFCKMHFSITLFYRLKSINMTVLCLDEKMKGCRRCLTVFCLKFKNSTKGVLYFLNETLG